jgi:hypothetical protein
MKFCPHCGGDLSGFLAVAPSNASTPAVTATGKYDQVKTWRVLIEKAQAIQADPPDVVALAMEMGRQLDHLVKTMSSEKGLRTIVHMVFDRKIVPDGGALYMAAMSDGRAGPQDPSYFKSRGYLVEDDRVVVSSQAASPVASA